jgi:hypothetical protein
MTLIATKSLMGGTQKVYRYPNGYGASVLQHMYSYGGNEGLWELAVIMFPTKSDKNYSLTYRTPITDDVMGYLSWDAVEETLKRIEEL